jgi:hypothetical protein
VILREAGPPNLVYASERITYIVDKRSYFPLEWAALYRTYGEFPGLVVTRYLRFEILPATPKSEALLKIRRQAAALPTLTLTTDAFRAADTRCAGTSR